MKAYIGEPDGRYGDRSKMMHPLIDTDLMGQIWHR